MSDLPTDVVAHAICYNPRGSVGAGTPQGFRASAVSAEQLMARAAEALRK